MTYLLHLVLTVSPLYYTVEGAAAANGLTNWRLDKESSRALLYRNIRDQSSLDIFAYRCTKQDLDQSWAIHNTSSVRYKGPNAPFSDLPLGTHVQRYESVGTVTLSVRNGDTFSTIMIQRRGTGPKGNVTWHAADRDGDRIDAEGIARRLIALVEGRWSTEAGDSMFNGVRLPVSRMKHGKQSPLIEVDNHTLGMSP